MNKEEIISLTNRVKRLEQRVNLLASIADYDKHPFTLTCLEADMEPNQIDSVLRLINKAEHSFQTKTPMNFSEFSKELYQIVPSHKDKPEFAKSIVVALHKKDKFSNIYDHFKADIT